MSVTVKPLPATRGQVFTTSVISAFMPGHQMYPWATVFTPGWVEPAHSWLGLYMRCPCTQHTHQAHSVHSSSNWSVGLVGYGQAQPARKHEPTCTKDLLKAILWCGWTNGSIEERWLRSRVRSSGMHVSSWRHQMLPSFVYTDFRRGSALHKESGGWSDFTTKWCPYTGMCELSWQ